MQLDQEGMLVRTGPDVQFREKQVDFPSNDQEETVLFKLVKNGRNYEIHPINSNEPNDRLWMVIRNLKETGYKIKKHDIIKLGRMKFRVKEYRTKLEYFDELDEKSPHEGFDESKNIADTEDLATDDQDEQNPACRFCWISEHTDDNPIFRSCNCSGSIKYIHFQCIKAWLSSKVSIKGEDTHTTLTWKQFEWELCKMAYPYWFVYKGRRWNLVDLKRPEDTSTPYIILESLNSEKNSSRTIHTVVIKNDKRSFQLGRGHDSDLRINDISVSRKHASIEYREDGFYVVDYQSKFGTLVLLSDWIKITEDSHKTVQIGRTVVTSKAKSTSKVPEFNPKGNNISEKNNWPKDSEDNFDNDSSYKFDKTTKVVEINGKKYLVRPEIEGEHLDDRGKLNSNISIPLHFFHN